MNVKYVNRITNSRKRTSILNTNSPFENYLQMKIDSTEIAEYG